MTVGFAPATLTAVSAGEVVTGNDGFSISLLVFCQKKQTAKKQKQNKTFFISRKTFAPWTLQTTLLQPPWACDCLLFKGLELVKVATHVAMCSFGMLLMALNNILSSFMPSDIFIINVNNNNNKTTFTLMTNEAFMSCLVWLLEGLSF